MRDWQSQAHVKHYCRYPVVFVPKYRKKALYGTLRKEIGGIFRDYLQVKRNFTGRHFWARGYCVSTVGLDEQMIREYIKNQEREEKRQEQMRIEGL